MQKNAVPGNRWKSFVNAVVMHGLFPVNGCVRRDVIASSVLLKNERLGFAKSPGQLLVRLAAESLDVDVACTPGKHQGIVGVVECHYTDEGKSDCGQMIFCGLHGCSPC